MNPKVIVPQVQWVTVEDGTQEDGEETDYAAWIVGDARTSGLIKASRDFRGLP